MTHHIMPGTASRGQGDFGDRWVLSCAMLGLACLAADLGDAQLPLAYVHGMALSPRPSHRPRPQTCSGCLILPRAGASAVAAGSSRTGFKPGSEVPVLISDSPDEILGRHLERGNHR
jgi:hypothetical protein